MNRKKTRTLCVDGLETRSLLSGFGGPGAGGGFGDEGPGGFGGFGGLNLNRLAHSSNPTIVADVTKIRTDQATLMTDTQSLVPTLRTDFQAIQTATDTSTTVQAARTTLKTDQATAQSLLSADFKAIRVATTSDARTAAIAQLRTDQASTAATLKVDYGNIQSAIDTDPAIQAARTKLATDTAVITKDQAALQADFDQLYADLKAAKTTTSNS